VLVALLLGIVVAGSWQDADRIEQRSLAVHHGGPRGPVHSPLEVTSFARGQVTLRRTVDVPSDPLRTSDVYGLVWPGGRGVVSGPPDLQPGGRARRVLKVTAGTAPVPGAGASLDRSVWTDPRAAYGVGFDDVAVPCADGRCPAWYVPGRGSTWLLLVHGRGASRAETLRAMGPALHAGMPALALTYRNDVGAPADPTGRYRYGDTEWRDLDAGVDWASRHGARHVVLFGASMGGAIVASFLAHSPSAPLVRGVVLDSPALDLRGLVRTEDHLGLVRSAGAEWIAGLRFGIDWSAGDHLGGSWLEVPALVFQGTADRTVLPATSDRLRSAFPALVQEVRVRGAAHVQSWNVDPAAYQRRESAFLECVTGPAQAAGCR
jgi:pimeloyl-ACP methyl ester carboxylesterase